MLLCPKPVIVQGLEQAGFDVGPHPSDIEAIDFNRELIHNTVEALLNRYAIEAHTRSQDLESAHDKDYSSWGIERDPSFEEKGGYCI